MTDPDIRWIQRFFNYKKALKTLTEALELSAERSLSKLEEQGLIQSFEYTHELAWKTMKDFLKDKGNNEVYGSKDATREFFKLQLLNDGQIWMDMIDSRNQTSHTYNEETARSIVESILKKYYQELILFRDSLESLAGK